MEAMYNKDIAINLVIKNKYQYRKKSFRIKNGLKCSCAAINKVILDYSIKYKGFNLK